MKGSISMFIRASTQSATHTVIYFARPYADWARELIEKPNEFMRQHFPKHCDLMTVPKNKIKHAMDKLDNRSKKVTWLQNNI